MRICVLALSLLLLVSCSKSQERQELAHSLVREIPAQSLSHALHIAEAAKLTCKNQEECPENVGLYVAAANDSVFTCTGFLVAEDIFATNSHCLPFAVKNLPDLCGERVRVILPGSGEKKEESVACKEVLGASERPNAISPDLTLLKLKKKTGRSPLPLDHSGVKPNEIHTTFKINPGDGASGTLIAQTCLAVPDSYRFPLYKSAEDSVFLVGDCASLPGNSGAPLLSAEGKAVGIFQAALETGEAHHKAWGPYLLPGEDFAPLAIGTSLRCLTSADWKWNPECAPIDDETIERPRIEDFAGKLKPELDEKIAPFLTALPKEFSWERQILKTRTLDREETLAPACFLSLEAPLTDSEDEATQLEPEEQVQFEVELPILKSKVQFNRYLQLSAAVEVMGTTLETLTYSPRSLREEGMSLVTLGSKAPLELPFCPTD